ncbi:MAG TPA: hypothetical protein VF601_16860 [Beijerinckiaceae bacterium]|jgi:hypothetical protein
MNMDMKPAAAYRSAEALGGPSKACLSCSRIEIGKPFKTISKARVFFGLFFVYAPIVFLPLFVFSGLLVHVHLRLMGARNLKTLRDFLPERSSHRYSYKTQVTVREGPKLAFWSRHRAFWIFNCTWYCPVSVAVIEWNAYLVKAVENWWCPFHHAKKPNYDTSALDASFWHISSNVQELHPDDRDNPIWNEEAGARRGE